LRVAAPALLLFGTLSVSGLAAGEPVKPLNTWTGKPRSNELRKEAPEGGVIADKAKFEKLWKAWRGDEKVPAVDFDKNVIAVELANGPNVPMASFTLDERGDLNWRSFSTRVGGPGFGYAIAEVPREGVKTIKGKAVPKKEE